MDKAAETALAAEVNMRLKKRMIILGVFVFFILANIAIFSLGQLPQINQAGSLYDFKRINKVNPMIEVDFQEEIELRNATLYGINDALMEKNQDLFQQFLSTGNIVFLLSIPALSIPVTTEVYSNSVSVTPQMPLFNGYFVLRLQVVDLIGNAATHYEYLYLNITETNIIIIEPRLGVSNMEVNNLTISTTRNGLPENTECKIGVDNPYYNFNSLALRPFETPAEMKPEHTAANVFSMFGLGTYGQFYILCKDQTLGRVNQKRFDIYIDTLPPSISAFTFVPPKIVEYPETGDQLQAVLSITAGEPVICRYSFGEDKNYTDMAPFDNFNLYNFEAYKLENGQAHALPSEQKATYRFYAQCEDRAGWRTEKRTADIEVDLSAGLGIGVVFPPRYTTNKSIELIATTNKRASCQISGGSISQQTSMLAMPDQKTHRYNLGQLKDGTYTNTIYCRSTAAGILQDQTYAYTFTIDNTKPTGLPDVNGSLITCYNDQFAFEPPLLLNAVDEESGISHFLLDIRKGTETLVNGTRIASPFPGIDEDSKGNSFALENNTAYSFSVRAVNNVGLEGSPRTFTVSYNPKNEICFEKNPPAVTISENKSRGLTVVTFECSDESGCDQNAFYYGAGNSVENCTADIKLPGPPFTADVRETSHICYFASDLVGNNATGTQLIEVEVSDYCSDAKKDGDETGIDCGGSCPPCDLNQSCTIDTDCNSNYCVDGICAKAACDDNILNGPLNNEESDIDCGGYCSDLGFKCDSDKMCFLDDDCKSSFCNPDEGVCAESTCSDGFKGPDETDVDCGGVCASEQLLLCDVGLGCESGDDCTTGNCIAGKCKEKIELVVKEEFPIGTVFIVIGLLMMVGGAGYLIYKRKILAVPAAKAGAATAMPRIEDIERERARRLAEERRRRALEEQKRRAIEERARKEGEARRRREGFESRRIEEREKIFGKFGEKRLVQKRRMTLEKEITEADREGWLSLGALKEKFMPAKQKKEELEKRALEAPAAPKPSTIFEQLGRIEEDKEGDIYRRLEEVGVRRGKEAFEEFQRLKPGKREDIYNELRKQIKPSKRKPNRK